ncbi:hypothetical protein Tco_0313993 [Tanacetum coccineum]
MMTYLKNTSGYKYSQLKGKTYEEVHELYERQQKRNQDFIPMDSEKEAQKLGKRLKRVAGSYATQKLPKKSKVMKFAKNVIEEEAAEYEKEKDELRLSLKIISGDDSEVNYEPLSRRFPIVNWEYKLLGNVDAKDMYVYKLTRADGSSSYHGDMQAFLRRLDRHDLNDLYRTKTTAMPSVDIPQGMDTGGSPRCQDTMGGAPAQTRSERVLEQPIEPPLSEGNTSGSGEGRMEHQFELTANVPITPYDSPLPGGYTPGSDEDPQTKEKSQEIRKTKEVKHLTTKKEEIQTVHTLFMDGTPMEINMLVEKKYPLIKELLEKMLNLQLEAEEESTMAFELIKFIKSMLEESWLSLLSQFHQIRLRRVWRHLLDELSCLVLSLPPSPDYTPTSPDYSPAYDTEFDLSEDASSDHIPPLPATLPFLSSTDDFSDSDIPDTPPSPTYGTPFAETTLST